MSLEAKGLTFGYRRKGEAVLTQVDLELRPGERLGLTAPSGRGKTTLCKLLSGYERPDAGEVRVDGRPLSAYRGPCPVQMIWQHPELVVDPLRTLGATLAEGWAVEDRVLEGLHIESGWMRRYPSELSGGELQRFCVARALGPETRYLLCDELSAMPRPSSGSSCSTRRSAGTWGSSSSATARPCWSGCALGWSAWRSSPAADAAPRHRLSRPQAAAELHPCGAAIDAILHYYGYDALLPLSGT
ncbi:ATP-binding cassette domain-containing protein [uncultured Intestinimonas sp.]|uniref:ATP-binding cassette domain-containing protein n=1 Tax=uncultured Intestinimonas sp. TaxID=1689265 RepID=UPI00345A7888